MSVSLSLSLSLSRPLPPLVALNRRFPSPAARPQYVRTYVDSHIVFVFPAMWRRKKRDGIQWLTVSSRADNGRGERRERPQWVETGWHIPAGRPADYVAVGRRCRRRTMPKEGRTVGAGSAKINSALLFPNFSSPTPPCALHFSRVIRPPPSPLRALPANKVGTGPKKKKNPARNRASLRDSRFPPSYASLASFLSHRTSTSVAVDETRR